MARGKPGWQPEDDPQPAPDLRKSGAQRFSVKAVRGRRATYSRFEIVRATIVVLGLVAAGLFGVAEWLALRPPAYPTPILPTISVRPVTVTPIPSPGGPVTQTLEASPLITETATPSPTRTATPAPSRAVRPRPTDTRPPATATSFPPPSLLDPVAGATLRGTAVFRWQWTGPSLKPNQAFDLRIWSVQEEQQGSTRRGAVAPTRNTEASVNLPYAPAIQDYGSGDYYWTVVVVEMSVDGSSQVVGPWGESRRFVFR